MVEKDFTTIDAENDNDKQKPKEGETNLQTSCKYFPRPSSSSAMLPTSFESVQTAGHVWVSGDLCGLPWTAFLWCGGGSPRSVDFEWGRLVLEVFVFISATVAGSFLLGDNLFYNKQNNNEKKGIWSLLNAG